MASRCHKIVSRTKDSAEILIYEQIGKDFLDDSGITAHAFIRDLGKIGAVKDITLRINSPGGSVFDGLAIYNALRAHPAQKTVHVDGIAASIASVIAMAGDLVVMPSNAMMMIHDPSTYAAGTAEDMRKQAEVLDAVKASIVSVYVQKTSRSEEEVSSWMSDERWMSAHEAVSLGFADEIGDPVRVTNSFDLSHYRNSPFPAAPVGITQEETPMEKCTICGADKVDGKCPSCVAAQNAERERVSQILALGESTGLKDLAARCVSDGTDVKTFVNRTLEATRSKPIDLTPKVEVTPNILDKPFRNFGEYLQTVASAGRPGNRVDPRLFRNVTGAGEGIPSDGGYLVGEEYSTALLAKVHETGVISSRCRKISIGEGANGIKFPLVDETSRATGSRWGGVQVYRVDEGETVTATKPKTAMMQLSLSKLMGVAYATDELLQDASALESIITQAFSEEFAFKIDDEILHGTGAGSMAGIMASGALVTVSKDSNQTADTVSVANVQKMFSRMYSRGKTNGVWLINADVWPQLLALTVGSETPVFMPPTGLVGSPYGTLFGRPIVEVEHCATLGDKGDILFLDLSQYLIIEKGGLGAESSVHVRFLYDEQTFKFTLRNNGQPLWKSALTPYKGSSTVSPFICLEAR